MNILFWYLWGKLFPYKTKTERKKLYEKVLGYMEEHSNFKSGFCWFLYKQSKFNFVGELWKLPELYKYRPKKSYNNHLWFDLDECGMKTRKTILRTIINEL